MNMAFQVKYVDSNDTFYFFTKKELNKILRQVQNWSSAEQNTFLRLTWLFLGLLF